MKRARVLVVAAVAALFTVVALSAQTPPQHLKKVGDHWTAWDPPAIVAEGAQVHIIQRGDTLWDLAERFYGNPYLWPQIWERNPYILDAHWIYPGDPLLLGFEVEPAEVLEQTADADGDGELDSGTGRDGRLRLPGRIQRLGSQDDIYCSGFVGELEEDFPFVITGSEYEVQTPTLRLDSRARLEDRSGTTRDSIKVGLSTGDIVYMDGGFGAGLVPGDLYSAVMPGPVVRHPVSEEVYGRQYDYLGQIRVLSVQEDTAIAEIAQACRPILVGSMLRPFVVEPVPSERRTPLRPVNLPSRAESLADSPIIVHSKDGIVSLGQDHVVFVDLGVGDGVEPGDIFTVYRMPKRSNPPVILGEVAILSVHPLSAVGKIIESRYPIYVGDVLEAK